MGCGSSSDQVYEPETPGYKGQVIVTVKHAVLENDVNFLTSMDPYVILKMGDNQKFETPVHSGGGKFPKWNHAQTSFRKRVDKDDVITVQVWNKNLISKDSIIGEGAFSLTTVRQGNQTAKEINLKLYSKGHKAGTCSVDVQFTLDPSGKDLPEIVAPDTNGKLIVEPKDANILLDTLLLKMDPFVTIRFGDENLSSAVHNGGHNKPRWTDELQFTRETDENTLYIEVWNFSDYGSNDLIGVGYASITESLGLKEKIIKKCPLEFEGHPRGEIQVVITFQTNEPEKYMKNKPQQQNQTQQQQVALPQQLQNFAQNIGNRVGQLFGSNGQDGRVEFTYPNGDHYAGEYAGSFKQGQGRLTFARGGYYQGQFSNDQFHGQGELIYGDTKYVGTFISGRKHGQGTQTWQNGQAFAGFWENNSMHGEGEWTFPNGAKKHGVWANGNRVRWLDDEMNVIQAGKSMPQGFTISSPSGQFTLTLQYDGILAIYNNATRIPVYRSSPAQMPIRGPFYMRLEPHGELVLLDINGTPYYTSGLGAPNFQPPFVLKLQDDSRLVIQDSFGNIKWYSH